MFIAPVTAGFVLIACVAALAWLCFNAAAACAVRRLAVHAAGRFAVCTTDIVYIAPVAADFVLIACATVLA